MKFRIEKKRFLELLVPAGAASTNKNSLPALEGLLLTVENGVLSVCGYDLEKGIRTHDQVEYGEDGAVIANSQKLIAIVRTLPDCTVEVSSDSRNIVEISAGQAQFKIHGLASDVFPSLPDLGNDRSFEIRQDVLREMIQSTIFAAAVSDARPILCGELFKVEGSKLTVVALDNFRLALREEYDAVKNNEDCFSVIIPSRALSDLVKLIGDSADPVRVELTKKYAVFSIRNIIMFTRLIDGEYIDYRRAIPQECKISAVVDTGALAECVERTSLLVDEKLKTPLRCFFTDDALNISCSTQYGKAQDTIAVRKTGADIEIGFNNRYLLDAVRACRDESVTIELWTPLMSMVIRPTEKREDGSFLYLVGPCRLKD